MRNIKKMSRIELLLGMVLALSGCAISPYSVQEQSRPSSLPVRALKQLDDSLVCMDELMVQNNVPVLNLGIAIVEDNSEGSSGKGVEHMLRSAIVAMSKRSNRLRFIDMKPHGYVQGIYAPRVDEVKGEEEYLNEKLAAVKPLYYFSGSVTSDKSVSFESVNAGAGVQDVGDVSASYDLIQSIISLDLHLTDWYTRYHMPRGSVTNSMSFKRTGVAGDMQGIIKKFDFIFGVNMDRSESGRVALRTLTQLGAIELIGKIQGVPYERCLSLSGVEPEYTKGLATEFHQLKDPQQLEVIREALVDAGLLRRAAPKGRSRELGAAIQRFQAQQGLLPDGRISEQLYVELHARNSASKELALEGRSAIRISSTPPEHDGHFECGETVEFIVAAERDVAAYCYLLEPVGKMYRIFPNRFMPDPVLRSNSTVVIPPREAPFSIVLDGGVGGYQLKCLYGSLESGMGSRSGLWDRDLDSISGAKFEELFQAFSNAGVAISGEANHELHIFDQVCDVQHEQDGRG